jgi:hypothetical protein
MSDPALAWCVLPSAGKLRRDACLARLRVGLGDDEFELAYARGKSLSIQDIVSLAAQYRR